MKSVRTALVATAMLMTALVVTPHAQSSDPSAQPRLTFNDLYYVGAFRLPSTSANGDSFEFGGHQLAFNPASNSLFVGSRGNRVAEVSIPAAVNSSNPAAMPFASYLQPFSDPMEGHLSEIAPDGVSLDSLMVFGNRLIGTASVYYDANNTQKVSHFSHSLQLNEPSFRGWSRVWDDKKTGFVSGTMAVVPTEWRGLLGGPAATGQCCIPIVMRTSVGPAAFSFDPAQIGQPTVAANPLLYYTLDHATLGPWDNASPVYGSTSLMGGMVMVAGTRTVLYFGSNGMGTNCYGNGTADQSLVGTMGSDGAHYCYDPTSNAKGQHAYPYRYQIWAYDMNDLAAVKSGAKQPWEVQPYGVWPFDFPTHDDQMHIGGVAYDQAHQLLYVSQMLVDKDGYAYRPLIHVLHVNATPGTVDPNDATPMSRPAATAASVTTPGTPTSSAVTSALTASPAPVASSSAVVGAITLSVNKSSPQVAGTAITFSAYAIGGGAAQEYKWLVNNGTGFSAATGWSTTDTFAWTPTLGNPKYHVRVWARSAGNTEDDPEALATATFAVTASPGAPAPVPMLPLRSVEIASDKAAPQPQGTVVTFTATTDGGANLEYKWLLHDGLSWSAVTGWSSQKTFVWTPATANPGYRIGVWVRTAGNTEEGGEVTRSKDFAISAPANSTATSVATTTVPVVPTVTLASATLQPGAKIQFTVNGRQGHPTDWVSLSTPAAAGNGFIDWMYLTGAKAKPATAPAAAALSFTAPTEPGTYVIRFFADNGYDRLAMSATITVTGPEVTLASATVHAGAMIQFAVNGRGAAHPSDWVALSASTAPDNGYSSWLYLNGAKTAPATGVAAAALTLTAPSTPGVYVIRLFGDNALNRIASSALITVVP